MTENVLHKIELNHQVASVKTKLGIEIWPLLRHRVYFEILKKQTNYSTKKRTRSKIQLFKNFFYGFSNLYKLRKFEFLYFENTNKRIEINNKYYDVYFDAWADKFGRDRSLFIEFANHKYYKKSEVHTDHVISDLPFKLMSWLCGLFIYLKIENESVIQNIKEECGIKFDHKKELKRKLGELYWYKFLFKFAKIRAVFVLSSFSKTNVVMAAKQLGIKVYEAQHGYIGSTHPFYSAKVKFPMSYPDFLFSFGTYETLDNSELIFKNDQIIPIGGLELEFLKAQPIPDALKQLRNKYSKIFCLTMQALKEEELLDAVLRYARENDNSLFVIRPKDKSFNYENYTDKKNIILLPEYSIYDVLKISDFNITIFSTTAVEGPVLGAKTIFYNADNLSKKYFKIDQLDVALIEEGKQLNDEHLNVFSGSKATYYRDHYLTNVENASLQI